MSATGSSLHQLIRAGDPDAIAGFRDAHIHRIRRYVEVACSPELRDEASEAALVDFLGRVATAPDEDLEEQLLKSIRSCAAGRFDVQVPSTGARQTDAPEPICLAMPELLAAFANGELPGQHDAAQHHLDHCPTCAATAERMARAEQAFAQAPEWGPEPEQSLPVEEDEPAPLAEPEPVAEVEPAPEPISASEPEPATPPPPPGPAAPPPAAAPRPPAPVIRRRQGGLVGAARRALRDR